jgi:transposase
MIPSAINLSKHLRKKYPKGRYYSVYEAGFCGYHIHHKLEKEGIENIIINPADIPTSHKEKQRKTDKVDSRKLSRALENQSLEGIYIPNQFQIELRSLTRLRYALVKEQTRIRNRIKAVLYFYGIDNLAMERYWSGNYISRLKEITFKYEYGKNHLLICIEELERVREQIAHIMKILRKASKEYSFGKIINRLINSVPGIGFTTAINLYTEIMDMNRFKNIEKLASYVGLVPSLYSSGEKEYTRGLTVRSSKYLRYLLVEAAWIAIRKDEALFLYYSKHLRKSESRRAIISVARKLLNRIRHVWLTEEDYVKGII